MNHSFRARSELSPARQALLELLLEEEGLGSACAQELPRTQASQPLTLSFAEQRLWFLDQFEPGSVAYNMPAAVLLQGPLDVGALERSLSEILRRHEVLRTTFPFKEGQPARVIAPAESLRLPLVDLQGLPEAETEARRLVGEEARRPFDLARGPLVRASLLRLRKEQHIFLLSMHHIVSDGWSMGVLWREVSVLYNAFSAGQPSPLSELALQYADFAMWQRQWLQGEVLENQLSYWRSQLAGAPSAIDLPTDRPRPAAQTYRGATQSIVLGWNLSEGLKELSRRAGTTLFMTLLAAFNTLLYRYTGQDDIVVGSPIAGRTRTEVEGLIGLFVNTLALRTDLSGDPSFRELLGRVREVALEAYAHQDLPFEKLVEELQPERDLSRSPLFQVMFVLQNAPMTPLRLSGLTVTPLKVESKTTKFDLTLSMVEQSDTLRASVQYSTDLFNAATISRMLGHFQTLLGGIVANPDHRISRLSLLTKEERNQLSTRANPIRVTNPFVEFRKEEIEQSIPSRFEQQAARDPDHIAVRTRNHRWTYRELNQTANRIARALLRACGSGEGRVGLLFGHDAPMIAGILGALKAGKTYVPLDPAYPVQRLVYMMEDSQASAMLTDNRNIALAGTVTDGRLLLVNIDDAQNAELASNPNVGISPATPAYILYTSGSTGQPKGVMQDHRNVLHFIRAYTNSLHLNAHDRLTLFSSYSHDAAVVDIFAALSSGATLCPWSVKEDGLDGLAEWLVNEKTTIYHSTPTLYRNFIDTLDPKSRFPEFRAVVLGGETLVKDDFARFKRHFSEDCVLFNLYGSTESTINLLYAMNAQTELTHNLPPVGYPVEDTEVLLLNKAGEQAQVYGEIGIRSAHVALGYWHRPEITRGAFLPDREGGTKRIYRSGDMGRLLADGSIAFLGRKDFQVKLRGFRIELGEVETVLGQHPAVREAVVLAGDKAAGQERLVAYVVANRDRAPTIAGRRRFKLPNQMAVAQLNKHETDYLYEEIFERQAYLRHGIAIREGDCVFDVGANIGVFALFVHQVCKSARVYAFEPNPFAFETLSINASLYARGARLFKYGLSDEAKTASFTFFPGYSLLSGFYADAQVERGVVKTFLLNQQKARRADDPAEFLEHADAILQERFSSTTFPTQLRTLSSVMEEQGVECIDLLKINVEKSELDVLRGIKDADWKRIKQIVLEVDVQENLRAILSLLERQGYEYVVEQAVLLEGTELHYIYAIRPSADRRLDRSAERDVKRLPTLTDSLVSSDALRRFLREKLPEYMVPSAFVFLDELPLTASGKVDRKALPAPGVGDVAPEAGAVAPRTATEEMVMGLFRGVLERADFGVLDSFFDLGGHSLMAARLMARLRTASGIDLPLRNLFERPTVAGMAEAIDALSWSAKPNAPAGASGDREEIEL